MNTEQLASQLRLDEGVCARMYLDTATPPRWTVGVGRNISDRDFSDDEIELMLKNDIALVAAQLDAAMPWWRELSESRQGVLANMAFNMGIARLMGFKQALAAMQTRRYMLASDEMLDSAWARQTGARAIRLARIMREGGV